MGSYINFKNFGDNRQVEGSDGGGGGMMQGDFPLARQSSIYSLTLDELQNTWSGLGKDFGSMNMDELLKNIWTAEETQAMTSVTGGTIGNGQTGNLQRQGSLTLPRTLSQKTVDEVWRDLLKEEGGVKEDGGFLRSNAPQREPTLGEMTLEEFLARAGVVREDTQQTVRQGNGGFYELSQPSNDNVTIEFQQPSRNNGILGNAITTNNNSVMNQPLSLPQSVGAVRSSQQYQRQQQPPLFPKQSTTVTFAPPMNLVNGAMDRSMNNNVVQGGGLSMVGLGNGGITVAAISPANHRQSDIIKSNVDTSPISPIPCSFNRGRKSGALEKVVERRQRRMIKNRESAARSRARKQAYTLELEAEIAKQKEMNEELQRKLAGVIEMQKNQILEKVNRPRGGKRRCLTRTLTGPW